MLSARTSAARTASSKAVRHRSQNAVFAEVYKVVLILIEDGLHSRGEFIDVRSLKDAAVVSGDLDDVNIAGYNLTPVEIRSESVKQRSHPGSKQYKAPRI